MEAIGGMNIISIGGFFCYFLIDFCVLVFAILTLVVGRQQNTSVSTCLCNQHRKLNHHEPFFSMCLFSSFSFSVVMKFPYLTSRH